VPIAIALLIVVARRQGPFFGRFAAASRDVPPLLVFPIVVGGLINGALAFPVIAALSFIYPVTSPYVLMAGYGSILTHLSVADGPCSARVSPLLVSTFLFAILTNRLLTAGVL
jgi:hypothetical protein